MEDEIHSFIVDEGSGHVEHGVAREDAACRYEVLDGCANPRCVGTLVEICEIAHTGNNVARGRIWDHAAGLLDEVLGKRFWHPAELPLDRLAHWCANR